MIADVMPGCLATATCTIERLRLAKNSCRFATTSNCMSCQQRQVDVEIPAPTPVIGDPSAQGGPDDRRRHDPQPPRRHRLFLRREALHHDRLRGWHHRGSCQSLQKPEHHHLIEAARRAAHSGGKQKGDHRNKKITLAPEARRDPCGHRNHDSIDQQVTGRYPGDLINTCRKCALHVRQRDIHDRGVEYLERRPRQYRGRDQPLMAVAGLTMGPRAIAMVISLIMVGQLARFNFDTRLTVSIGFMLSAFGLWQMSHFELHMGIWNFSCPAFTRVSAPG